MDKSEISSHHIARAVTDNMCRSLNDELTSFNDIGTYVR